MRTCAQAFIVVCLAAAVGSAQGGPLTPSAGTPATQPAKTPPGAALPFGPGAVYVQAMQDAATATVPGAEVPGVDLSPAQQARVNALILERNQALAVFDRAAETNVSVLQVQLAAAINPRMAGQIQQKLDRIAFQRQALADRTDLMVVCQVLTPQQRLQRNRAILASQAMLDLEPVDLSAHQINLLNRMVNRAAMERGSYSDINAGGLPISPLAAQFIMSALDPQQRFQLSIINPGGISSGSGSSRAAAASTAEVRANQAGPRTQSPSETRSLQKSIRRDGGGDAPAVGGDRHH